ncbi:membrane-bound lytic murein transglycosylase B [Rhodovulum bhavnagarense]|uniref:Membrane-bound lytic murein transglycosylase B n=1 Tax=Rhodovulum bhavnagarense TaxID=992286 RepID=A0A4R2RCE3_9RHOB|nr:lytic murein transglycosylase [Rhodovulum bhavnagarense]TCP60064.1 membrane-bound lytic murein transglycosylase B [Rhodovulum bhavnagarense]
MPVTRLFVAALCAATVQGAAAQAAGLDSVPRPQGRPGDTVAATSPRPASRPAVTMETDLKPVQVSTANIGFQRWIDGFRDRALAQGISAPVFDRAFAGLRYNTDVIDRDRNQSEFTKTIWDYLDSAASDTRIRNGQAALREHARLLERIEARYGVDKEVVVAVWGLESAYGEFRGKTPIIEALATLAYDGRRGRFFEQQLIAALKILQSGDTTPRNMTGSWAGAMGHTQFIPTSYLAYAVDFTGDGRRDIWADDPADALASTAAYLARFGWTKGQPWGVEVRLPRDFNVQLADRDVKRMPSQWGAMGVRDMSGRTVPDYGRASILLPAGARGAAFMIFDNFAVIERYNTADAYVIGVGHLSDRLRGGGPIQAAWPRGDRALLFAERQELQERLTRAGFDTRGIDGKIGPNTIAAVRAYQRSVGLVPDGYASLDLLKRLR